MDVRAYRVRNILASPAHEDGKGRTGSERLVLWSTFYYVLAI